MQSVRSLSFSLQPFIQLNDVFRCKDASDLLEYQCIEDIVKAGVSVLAQSAEEIFTGPQHFYDVTCTNLGTKLRRIKRKLSRVD